MSEFVSSGNFTRFISVMVMVIITVGGGVLLAVMLVTNQTTNTAVLIGLSGALSSGLTYFARGSGMADGAGAVTGAVNTVSAAMTTAINASPGPVESVPVASQPVSVPTIG
jgi:hypothetical protein